MSIKKYGRYWAVYAGATLVCVCLYLCRESGK